MHSHEATCPHACKQIADWLTDLAVADAWFICEFESSKAVDRMATLHADDCEKVYAICWKKMSKNVNTNN